MEILIYGVFPYTRKQDVHKIRITSIWAEWTLNPFYNTHGNNSAFLWTFCSTVVFGPQCIFSGPVFFLGRSSKRHFETWEKSNIFSSQRERQIECVEVRIDGVQHPVSCPCRELDLKLSVFFCSLKSAGNVYIARFFGKVNMHSLKAKQILYITEKGRGISH